MICHSGHGDRLPAVATRPGHYTLPFNFINRIGTVNHIGMVVKAEYVPPCEIIDRTLQYTVTAQHT